VRKKHDLKSRDKWERSERYKRKRSEEIPSYCPKEDDNPLMLHAESPKGFQFPELEKYDGSEDQGTCSKLPSYNEDI